MKAWMAEAWSAVVKGSAGVLGAIAGLFGGWDIMMTVLLAAMALDYLTGWVVALMRKSRKTSSGGLDSKAGFIGLCKKCLILLFVVLGALIDRGMGMETAMFRSAICWFYVANEGLSIVENMALAGVPFPDWIKAALEQLKQKKGE